jgi:predicted ester cyclase
LALSSNAIADDKETVQVFYDFLSNPASEEHANKFRDVTTEGWESIGDYSGKAKSREQLVGQLGGFAKLIPDLNWKVEEMIEGDDRVVVRGRATGTPAGPLFGVDGKGKSFEIMSIDIHTLEDGKIIRTHHVEDWSGALQQLKGM